MGRGSTSGSSRLLIMSNESPRSRSNVPTRTRINKLEKLHNQIAGCGPGYHDHDNPAPAPGPNHLERPRDPLTIVKYAVALVRNDRQSKGVAKSRVATASDGRLNLSARETPRRFGSVPCARRTRNDKAVRLRVGKTMEKVSVNTLCFIVSDQRAKIDSFYKQR